MKQEDKKLLLQDLCARLPYGVKGNYQNSEDELLKKVKIMYRYLEPNGMVITGDIKPYLFPLSSMTEEQKREYNSLCNFVPTYHYEFGDIVEDTELYDNFESIDYLIANHFDYRGLIPMELAIDATGLSIY